MLALLKHTFTDFLEDRCPRIAAALAYSAAFSLAPMLVLIIGVCQLVFDAEDIRGKVAAEITAVVGEEGAEQVQTMIDSSGNSDERGALATIFGVVVMIVGATGFFAQLQAGMNDVWEVQPDPDKSTFKYFLLKRLLSFGMVLSVAFLVLISLAVSAGLKAFDGLVDRMLPGEAASTLLFAANLAISFLLLASLFAAMFKVLPDAAVEWRDVAVGATATAALFLLGKFAIGAYLGAKTWPRRTEQQAPSCWSSSGSIIQR